MSEIEVPSIEPDLQFSDVPLNDMLTTMVRLGCEALLRLPDEAHHLDDSATAERLAKALEEATHLREKNRRMTIKLDEAADHLNALMVENKSLREQARMLREALKRPVDQDLEAKALDRVMREPPHRRFHAS
jgi:predicted nuclease with TOPRIM domain